MPNIHLLFHVVQHEGIEEEWVHDILTGGSPCLSRGMLYLIRNKAEKYICVVQLIQLVVPCFVQNIFNIYTQY